MTLYKYSVLSMLKAMKVPVLPWQFPKIAHGYWKVGPELNYTHPFQNVANQKMFLAWAIKQLGKDINGRVSRFRATDLIDPSAWYSVEVDDVRKLGGGSLLSLYNEDLYKLLSKVYSFRVRGISDWN